MTMSSSGYWNMATRLLGEEGGGLPGEYSSLLSNKMINSSFYHHFADLEVFTEVLMEEHLKRASIVAERER